MKVYMSFWTNGILSGNTNINLWKLSLALAKKHYNNVELITDSYGQEILQDLPFDDFHIELNNIPSYNTIWSLGKIYAYKYACSFNESFLHLDSDVLLWEALPIELTSSDIFVQSYDRQLLINYVYDIQKLQQDLGFPTPMAWASHGSIFAYNMGIFGGTNINLINQYCDFVIDMINNPLHHNLWNALPGVITASDDIFDSSLTKSCFVEQGNLAIFCKNNNITPSMLFNDPEDISKTTYKKYTHLMSTKNIPTVIDNITQRVSQVPYNLEPKDVSIDHWHIIN